jgi:heat shock protein HtpX
MQQLKVFVLMAGLTAFVVVLGGYFFGEGGALLFFVFAALTNFGMYWFSDKVVLRMYKARVIGPEDAPDLYRMVDRLRQRAELPMPVVALAPSEQPNAFATGRNAKKAVVCVTHGLMKLVNPQELEGVIAHELAHIKHRHMFVSTMAATMAGAVGMLAFAARWGVILGGRGGDGDRNPLVLIVMSIVAPIAAMIIQFAISRQNEFQADRTGAMIAGSPMGLAEALGRLEGYAHRIPMDVNPAAAQLAIVNPLSAVRGRQMLGLFRTHPPTEERVARLRELAREGGMQGPLRSGA